MSHLRPTTARPGGVPGEARCQRSDGRWCWSTRLSQGHSREVGSSHNRVDQIGRRGTRQGRRACETMGYTPSRDHRATRVQASRWDRRTPPSTRGRRKRLPTCPAHAVRSRDTDPPYLPLSKPPRTGSVPTHRMQTERRPHVWITRIRPNGRVLQMLTGAVSVFRKRPGVVRDVRGYHCSSPCRGAVAYGRRKPVSLSRPGRSGAPLEPRSHHGRNIRSAGLRTAAGPRLSTCV